MKAIAAALIVLAVPASAEPNARPAPSVRDLYISCFLYVSGAHLREADVDRSFDGTACIAEAIYADAKWKGPISGDNTGRFCPLGGVEYEADPPRAMAYAYIEYVERNAAMFQFNDGEGVFLNALSKKWPCRP